MLEQSRFDDLVRGFAARTSRRGVLARAMQAALGAVATAGLRPDRTAAQAPCLDRGCRCRTGVLDSCIPGLACCANDPNLPGGHGTCVPPGECFGGMCSGDGVVCPATCTWGTNCAGCCTGHCGPEGVCSRGGCRSAGCDCITGTLAPCDEGLACCPTVEALLGGPGLCLPRGLCN
jgi:hypothetical protein